MKKHPNDMLFIDFQVCFLGSPTYDLYYTFGLSIQPDIKESQFDNLISIYHDELVLCLKKLEYTGKILSLRELHIELLKKGFLLAIFAIPMAFMVKEGSDESNLDNLVKQDESANSFKKSAFETKEYMKHLEALYTLLEKRGQLNF